MTVIGFWPSKIEGWRMKLSQYLNDFKIVDLVSEGEQADIALVWAPPAGQFKKCRICVALLCRAKASII